LHHKTTKKNNQPQRLTNKTQSADRPQQQQALPNSQSTDPPQQQQTQSTYRPLHLHHHKTNRQQALSTDRRQHKKKKTQSTDRPHNKTQSTDRPHNKKKQPTDWPPHHSRQSQQQLTSNTRRRPIH